MPWIRPTGWQDPDDAWEDEANAIDVDEGTFAICKDVPVREWSPKLFLTFPRSLVTGLKFKFGVEPLSSWTGWWEEHYDGVWWERVWIRVKPNKSTPCDVYVFAVYIEVRCRGPLAPICSTFHNIGDFLSGLADTISGVFIIGEWLSGPFRSLGETFHDLGDTCCEASGTLQDILNTLAEGIPVLDFAALLEEYFPLLYYLVIDTPGQVRYLIAQAFDLTPYEAQSAEFIIKTLFERYFPELYLLWRDPGAWFAATLKKRTPLLYYLIVDPKGQVLYLIAQAFDLTPYEAQSAEFIVKTLFERYFPELYLIWRDPDRWLDQRLQPLLDKLRDDLLEFIAAAWERLVDTYEDAFETISARLYYLVEHTLRFFWEGEW